MPSNKLPGPDKINPRVIKYCLPVILAPLTDIINCSLASCTFPDVWKLAEVIPLLREGEHEVASNNWPLSLLAVFSKVCERVALDKCLSSHQSGNRKFDSTAWDNQYYGNQYYLSKTFDSVSHPILLHKLSCVGASPDTVKWFSS